ncbi:hypothetical protein NMY22_g752 [Coprinellus aureogranulatus]|nr:hypothetical protein NMY22_g752 [Coprinellus aureogranulatus]
MSQLRLFDTASKASHSFKLPQELIDKVVDQLVEGKALDYKSLRATGLVGRSWYPRTRTHLFHSIIVELEEPLGECIEELQELQQLLDANPLLGSCVKRLTLNDVSQEWFTGESEQFGRITLGLFPQFSLLDHLSIFGVNENWLVWSTLPVQVQEAFYTLTSSSVFHSLTLESIDGVDVPRFLEGGNIKRLTLQDLCPPSSLVPSSPSSTASVDPPVLKMDTPSQQAHIFDYLSMGNCDKVFDPLFESAKARDDKTPAIIAKEILVTNLPWDDAMEETFTSVLTSSAEYVEAYAVEHELFQPIEDEDNIPPPPCIFAFDQIPNLKRLRATVLENKLHSRPELNPLPRFILGLEAISKLPTESQLEEVDLELYFSPREENTDVDDFFGRIPQDAQEFRIFNAQMEGFWGRLDRILSQPAFPRLRQVTIIFDFTSFFIIRDDWENAEASILGQMKSLASKGFVNINRRTDADDIELDWEWNPSDEGRVRKGVRFS